MAIEQFGQSLLAGQRQRQRRIGKQQRRMQREEALGTLVGGIGNAYLKDKTDQFLNNEANQAFKMNYKRHLNAASNIIDEYAEAEKTQGGIRQYLINKRATFLQQDAESEWADKIGEYSQGDLNRYYQQEAAKWADANIDGFKNAYNSALEMGTMEDFQTALARGYEGPANMADLVIKGVSGFFRGKNPANARSTVANQQRDNMLAAGKNIETYNAAINNGWDIDSAERLQAAVDNKTINRKGDKVIKSVGGTENRYVFGEQFTVEVIKKEIQKPDGSTEIVTELDPNGIQAAIYKSRLTPDAEGNIPSVIKTGETTSETVAGVRQTATEIIKVDPITGEEKFYSITFDIGSGGLAEASALVTDGDRNLVTDVINRQSPEKLYINDEFSDATYSVIWDAFATQLIPDGKAGDADLIKKLRDSIIDKTASEARVVAGMFGPTDETGEGLKNLYQRYSEGIIAITTDSALVKLASKMDLKANTFVSKTGHSLNIQDKGEMALDLLASAASLEQTATNAPALPAAFVKNMIDAVDTDMIMTSEDFPYLKNLFNRMSHGKDSVTTVENLEAFAQGLDKETSYQLLKIFRAIEGRLADTGRLDVTYLDSIEKDLNP